VHSVSVDPSVIGADLKQATDSASDKQRQADRSSRRQWLKEIKRIRNKEDNGARRPRRCWSAIGMTAAWMITSVSSTPMEHTGDHQAAIFARMPVPDVRRRYLTQDPIGRTAAMILERALSYSISTYDFKDHV